MTWRNFKNPYNHKINSTYVEEFEIKFLPHQQNHLQVERLDYFLKNSAVPKLVSGTDLTYSALILEK
jgi:hypothetical protein